MAARKNPKRDFLFVSKVIGKHVPIRPIILKIMGGILCRLWVEERDKYHDPNIEILVQALSSIQASISIDNLDNTTCSISEELLEEVNKVLAAPIELKHKTLFIGFAETATGIAQAVFSSSLNSFYIHTTRENITCIEPSVLFYEEHSHATDHMIYPLNPEIFDDAEDIVLIDDELTTGKTSLNLIRNLPASKTYGIISILDWRTDEHKEVFKNETTRNINLCSLIKGTIECEKSGDLNLKDPLDDYTNSPLINHKDICFNSPNLIDGFIHSTGRFGISSEENKAIEEELNGLAEVLKNERVEGNCLCLGTGEFIYIPCLLSDKLGDKVFFHSTTRSPIYSNNEPNYSIKNKVTFNSPDGSNVANYLYNIPKDFYEQVFVFSEKSYGEDEKNTFKKIFSYYNIKNIVFVSWNSDIYKRNVI